ncbi:MAG: abortive infection family protein [Phycisphaerales bacterium JB047]
MSSLTPKERRVLEKYLEMENGYVLHYSNRTFGYVFQDALGIDIQSEDYALNGTSKANRLRAFWDSESDHKVAVLLQAFLDDEDDPVDGSQRQQVQGIIKRLQSTGISLDNLREHAQPFTGKHLDESIDRMSKAIDQDPSLAIGSAKELVETCCKTILSERGIAYSSSSTIQELTKLAFKSLGLSASSIPAEKKSASTIKTLLSNLASVGGGLADLRNSYGTGHGKHGNETGLTRRHAKLAVGAATTLAVFLFDTHKELPIQSGELN